MNELVPYALKETECTSCSLSPFWTRKTTFELPVCIYVYQVFMKKVSTRKSKARAASSFLLEFIPFQNGNNDSYLPYLEKYIMSSYECYNNDAFMMWCENVYRGICGQRRPRSACASAQSDHRIHCPLTESLATTECMNREQKPG